MVAEKDCQRGWIVRIQGMPFNKLQKSVFAEEVIQASCWFYSCAPWRKWRPRKSAPVAVSQGWKGSGFFESRRRSQTAAAATGAFAASGIWRRPFLMKLAGLMVVF